VNFHGRNIDPVAFWSSYVEFPTHMGRDEEFAPLVHCPNPAHDNFRSPAFQVNLRHPLVHCFSDCGISGTYEHAICVVEGIYEKFQVKNATTKQEQLRRKTRALREAKKLILRGATGFSRREKVAPRKKKRVNLDYETFLPQVGQEYLAGRGISSNSISLWGFGWDSEEKRIVIPAHDENGKLKFLIKRAVLPSQHPKYLYSEGAVKTEILFGADKLRMGQDIVLVEGSLDVIAISQHGIPVAGILGTGISDAQVRVLANLRPRKIFLMYDKDLSGIKNIEIASNKLRRYPLFICRYPAGKSDPAELTGRQAHRAVQRAIPAVLWREKIRKKPAKSGLRNRPRDDTLARSPYVSTDEGRSKFGYKA
jgi:DNA primase